MSAHAPAGEDGGAEARRAPAWGGWSAAAAGVLAAFLLVGFLADAVSPGPSGPRSSSYATTSTGAAAWAELLARSRHPVSRLRQPLGQAVLDPGSTLVVLGVPSLTPAAARALARFVRAGGRLVIATASPRRVLPVLTPGAPAWVSPSPRRFEALAGAPETGGVAAVRTAGAGAWLGGAGLGVLRDRAGAALLLVRPLGRGRLELLADPSPVQNRLLASADNAQFALDLAGPPGRPVAFAEALHGFGAATGLAALPTSFWLAFAGLCLAGGAWALARGRRLGPPEAPAEIGQPPRSAYVDALAGALMRAGDRVGLARVTREQVGAEVERRLARRAAGAEVRSREAMIALGLSEAEADLVLAPASGRGSRRVPAGAPRRASGRAAPAEGEDELLVLGRLLARLRSER